MKKMIAFLILWNCVNTAGLFALDWYYDGVTVKIATHIGESHKRILEMIRND